MHVPVLFLQQDQNLLPTAGIHFAPHCLLLLSLTHEVHDSPESGSKTYRPAHLLRRCPPPPSKKAEPAAQNQRSGGGGGGGAWTVVSGGGEEQGHDPPTARCCRKALLNSAKIPPSDSQK